MEENLNYDFRTPLQRQQEARRKKILSMFAEYRSKAPDNSSDYRIMCAVAQQIGCTAQNVRALLIKQGVITPKKRKATAR